uniref:Uncharacterized protein n=1 Tax=Glossina palpalis gambiensis TaxID=67801 RepID=A0A1B0ALD3_9MUSC
MLSRALIVTRALTPTLTDANSEGLPSPGMNYSELASGTINRSNIVASVNEMFRLGAIIIP